MDHHHHNPHHHHHPHLPPPNHIHHRHPPHPHPHHIPFLPPPPPPPSHYPREGSFVISPPHPHPHHNHHPRNLPSPPDHVILHHNHNFIHNNHIDDVADRHRFQLAEPHRVPPLPREYSPPLHRQGNMIHRLSPPPLPNPPPTFVDVDRFRPRDRIYSPPPPPPLPPRFREEDYHVDDDVDLRLQLDEFRRDRMMMSDVEREDELFRHRIDDRRRVIVEEEMRRDRIDDRRMIMDDEREEFRRIDCRRRIEDGFYRDEVDFGRVDDRRIENEVHFDQIDDRRRIGEVVGRDERIHEPYHPEIVLREFEFNSDGRGEFEVDEARMRDRNVSSRCGGPGQMRDLSSSPIKFRSRGKMEVVSEEEINRALYGDRRREEREEFNDRFPRKNLLPKKSAFLRLQPAKQNSSSRNRVGSKTPSPSKGKEGNVDGLVHRLSEEERVGSPVELDVSFKSSVLVAKTVTTPPSSSGAHHAENAAVSDLGNRVSGESPSRGKSVKNQESNSFVQRKKGKQSENTVRVSPSMKRVGFRIKVDVPDGSSDSSSSGLSSLSGSGGSCKSSPKREIVGEDDKVAGYEKGSLPNVRKKRKGVNPLSRLSSSMPTNSDAIVFDTDNWVDPPSGGSTSEKTPKQCEKELSSCDNVSGSTQDDKVVVADNSVDPPSGGCISEKAAEQSEKELSSCNIVSGSTQDDKIVDAMKGDTIKCPNAGVQEEDVVLSTSGVSFSEKEGLESLPDLSQPLGTECVEDELRITTSDEALMQCRENLSADNATQKVSDQGSGFVSLVDDADPQKVSDQGSGFVPLVDDTETQKASDQCSGLVPAVDDNCSAEGASEPVLAGGVAHFQNIDTCGNLDANDSETFTDSTSSPVDVMTVTENQADLTSPADNSVKPNALLTEGGDLTGSLSGNVQRDGVDNGDLKHSGDHSDSENFLRIDVSSDDAFVCSEQLITVSHVKVRTDIQEQHCLGAASMSVDDETRERREESEKVCSAGGDVLLPSDGEKDFRLDKKRKAGFDLNTLDSENFESFPYLELNRSILKENSDLPAEEHSLTAPVPPSCFNESDVPYTICSMQSSADGVTSVNLGHPLDTNEYPSGCAKKRKVIPLESVSSDAPIFERCDLSAFSNAVVSVADRPVNSDKCLAQSAETFEPSNSEHPHETFLGETEAAESLHTSRCQFDDSINTDLLHTDACLSDMSAPVHEKQSLDVSGSWSSMKQDEELMGAVNSDGSGLGSVGELETTDRDSSLNCVLPDSARDSDDAPMAVDMECETIVDVDSDLSPLPDKAQLFVESTCGGSKTSSALLEKPSSVISLEATTIKTSSVIPSTNKPSNDKQCPSAKISSQYLRTQSAVSLQSNLQRKRNEINVKPGVLARAADQPVAQKTALLPLKHANKVVSSSSSMSRVFPRKNVLIRAETSLASGRVYPATAPSNKPVSTYPAKPRTWRRTDTPAVSNVLVRKPSVSTAPAQKPPLGNSLKVQHSSYIRKGNSLVRKPASGGATVGPRVGASISQSQPKDKNCGRKLMGSEKLDFTGSPDSLMSEARNPLIEMPKTPPLPCSSMTSDCDVLYPGESTTSPQIDQSEAMDSEDTLKISETPETSMNKDGEDAGTLSDGVLLNQNVNRIVYVKRKSNQLIATSSLSEQSVHHMESTAASSSDNNYYKRKKNQLIRASSESNIQQMVAAINESSNSHPQRALNVYCSRSSTRRVSNKGKSSKVPLVWKLGDSKSSAKAIEPLRSSKLLARILPWKRATYWRSVWRSSATFSNCPSIKTLKLPSSRKRAAVYVRSGRGFSLRRSKVISLAGSLKWSKSMEKRSKKVVEEAACAVAARDSVKKRKDGTSTVSSEARVRNFSSHKSVLGVKVSPGERVFRVGVFRYRMDPSRRTLQRIPDEDARETQASKPEKDSRKTYVPKRLLIGSNEYVRIGNGNQLVRDPKRRTRILASEKVRWSLHTARMRVAKKRKYCQFFTRFGQCNKGEGKCPYIHDPSKIAVCTKFLNGLCADSNCKLTHKVIPERMPDCSFFLQGLCSNDKCPYRHVNVNPKASICEGFLKGYCAEGNECRKKHSYMCPEFEATGSCPRGSKCKLYHRKKGTGKKRKSLNNQRNARGRYFGSGLTAIAKPETIILEKDVEPKNDVIVEGDLGDFISLDVSDDDAGESEASFSDATFLSEKDASSQSDELDELMKPLRILDMP